MLGRGKRRIALTTAAAVVVLGLATNEAVLSGTPAVTLGLIGVAFVAALITTLATLAPAVTLSEGDAEDLVRKRSREHSLGQLGRQDVLSKSIDELIPIVHVGEWRRRLRWQRSSRKPSTWSLSAVDRRRWAGLRKVNAASQDLRCPQRARRLSCGSCRATRDLRLGAGQIWWLAGR